MAFAIYYFKDKTVEVGKISWMSPDEQQQCPKLITQCPNLEDGDGWMEVKWDVKGRKKSDSPAFFPAKVLMFGDNYSDLCKKRQEFIRGQDIWQEAPKRKSKPNSKWKDVEEEDHEVPQKKKRKRANCAEKESANQMIEELKKQLANKVSSELTNSTEESSDEEQMPRNWSVAQQKIKELQREIKSLKEGHVKEILDSMRDLPAVVTQLKDVIEKITVQISTPASTWSTPTPPVGPSVSAPSSPQVFSDPDDMVLLVPGHDVKVPRRELKSLRTASSALYIGDIAVLIYGRETLSNSSLTGRQSGAHKDVESKPPLDNTKLDAILVHVQTKFPDTTMQDVRRIIRKKCNNISYAKQVTEKK
ncbi:BEN domain-containing protein 5-like [Solea solea]|uniref:BEN domain-containing protein 5-like n=1 Tax=Solea solea TaxID=90069 RepID=UPI00272CFBDF|nr:BEN domain-containing protein 5-like [Solea solea]